MLKNNCPWPGFTGPAQNGPSHIMKLYELLYIIGTQFTDPEIEAIRKSVISLIEKEGATISRHENLGKIKLAYPIKGMRHGTYILIHFSAEPSRLKDIDRQLRLTEEVLRHQIVAIPESAKDREYNITAYVPPLSEEGRAQRREEKKTAQTLDLHSSESSSTLKEIAPPPVMNNEESAPSMSMEELDKKLDQILEGDVTDNV